MYRKKVFGFGFLLTFYDEDILVGVGMVHRWNTPSGYLKTGHAGVGQSPASPVDIKKTLKLQ